MQLQTSRKEQRQKPGRVPETGAHTGSTTIRTELRTQFGDRVTWNDLRGRGSPDWVILGFVNQQGHCVDVVVSSSVGLFLASSIIRELTTISVM